MMSQQWFFHWDNTPMHTVVMVSSWFYTHGIQQLEHPPYLPVLAPVDFVLFRKFKEGLGSQSLDQDSIKNAWGRESPEHSPHLTSPPPQEASWSTAKSASASAASS
jgi:hypothetical protein